jgi:sorting nexin-1/2
MVTAPSLSASISFTRVYLVTPLNLSIYRRLSEHLVESMPGVIIPPLPEKQIIGRFDDDFIEYRMRAFEKFLNRVASHDKLSKSIYFETFLMASESTFAAAKLRSQTAVYSAATSTANWLGVAFSSITPKIGQRAETSERTAVDIQLDDVGEKVTRQIELMTTVREQAYELVKASCESSVALADLSSSFQAVGDIESNYDPTVGSLYSTTGVFISDLAVEVGKAARASIVSFEEPIIEQLNMLQSVRRALAQRENARMRYLGARMESVAAEAAHLKVYTSHLQYLHAVESNIIDITQAIGPEGSRDQILPRKLAFEDCQKSEKETKQKLEQITEEFLADYQRFKTEKAIDIRSLLLKYANMQVWLKKYISSLFI